MAITVNLYTFAKKLNSTARPTGGTSYDCILKEPCGVLNPSISLNLGTSTNPSSFNYAYIATFSRYYYITEWVYESGLWIATLQVDSMATWKTQIGSQNLYIARASSDYNGEVIDPMYPTTPEITRDYVSIGSPWDVSSISAGTFVVGIAGQSTTYYAFSAANFNIFMGTILSTDYVDDLTLGFASAYSELYWDANPLQFIVSVMWYPFTIPSTGITSLRVGFVDVLCVAKQVDEDYIETVSNTITVPRHPLASTRGNYLNNAPFSQYTLFYPPFGQIQLDSSYLATSDVLSTIAHVDLRTGAATLMAVSGSDSDRVLISWIHSQVGIPHQVSQIATKSNFADGSSVSDYFGSYIQTIGASATGMIGGAISTLSTMVKDAAQSLVPSARTIGGTGGMDSLQGPAILYCKFYDLLSEDLENRGRPLCERRTINTLSGYILVVDPDIEIAATEAENQEIRKYMEGGFHYE